MKTMRFVSLLLALVACGDDDGRVTDSGTPGADGALPPGDGGGIPGVDGGGTPGVDGGGTPGVDGGGTPGVDGGPRPDGGTSTGGPDSVGPFTVMRQTGMVGESAATAFVPMVSSPVPLVVFKHGFQLATSNYAITMERLASHGFVVVGVDSGGGFLGGPTNVEEQMGVSAAIDWATTSAPFAASVDDERVGVAGHSRGGKVSVMVAAADARVDAALLLDPVNGCGPGQSFSATCPDVTGAAFAGALRMPVGVMGETNNATGGFMPCAPAAQNYQTIYDAISMSSWAVEWTFAGADHNDFTDDGGSIPGIPFEACPDGPGDDMMIRAQMRAMTVAFFRRHLAGDAAMDPWLTGAMVGAGITVEGP